MTTWSIAEAAEKCGLSQHTLRWYERRPRRAHPGAKRVKWLEQNVAALDVTLTAEELAILDPLATQVTGARY